MVFLKGHPSLQLGPVVHQAPLAERAALKQVKTIPIADGATRLLEQLHQRARLERHGAQQPPHARQLLPNVRPAGSGFG